MLRYIYLAISLLLFSTTFVNARVGKTLKVDRGVTKDAKTCISCHAEKQPGIVADWKESRHGHVGVSCIDCHGVEKQAKVAAQNCPGVKGTKIYVSALVSPKTCGKCHADEVEQFSNSGHARARKQYIPKEGLKKLIETHEGRGIKKFKRTSDETGCMQCHGSIIKLDKNKRPTKECYPTAGMGTVYPDGGVGNCTACHTRHLFSIAEARKPDACASCHLGPDHPDIEIFENSKHGHIYKTQGDSWNYNSAPDAWEPGDYRAPVCATCHQSGIGDLQTTHNVSERLHWNLWAKRSEVRNSKDPMSAMTGDGVKGRELMKNVCSNCHTTTHTNNYFEQADGMVNLYNEGYYDPAKKMYDDLKAKGLLKENMWKDEFQKIYYHLWHHEGRRMRQGALMGAPDYAHWHGVFECQQDINELEMIYEKRIKTGKIEE